MGFYHNSCIAITGASSFTACWLIKELSVEFKVKAIYQKPKLSYSKLKRQRIQFSESFCETHENIKAEENMSDWILQNKPKVWIHHHHFMDHYRSENYNIAQSIKSNVDTLENIFSSLYNIKCEKVIFSSTLLEQDELSNPVLTTPYGKSKYLVWQKMLELQKKFPLNLVKIIIPNPVGPFENLDRLVPLIIRHGLKNSPYKLASPNSFQQNIPVQELAIFYKEVCLENYKSDHLVLRPKSVKTTVLSFSHEVNQLLLPKLGLKPVKILNDKNEELTLEINHLNHWSMENYWEEYAKILTQYSYKDWFN